MRFFGFYLVGRYNSYLEWQKSYDCDPDMDCLKVDYDFCTTLSSFRECNMVQHSKLHLLSKSANDVQNLCKMHYARTY
ncbi:hypothetical protein BpHYR1_041859 [Brachionus plicatilis]|uniref:Uncharacterized protein n=1 Tax=Brachionus plicatilis TaxID=10195 RepID=A0A3M7Q2W4_BRAPC|nr:hypothetical protein BpHYR1_041859 [Brachionus plicatilis]